MLNGWILSFLFISVIGINSVNNNTHNNQIIINRVDIDVPKKDIYNGIDISKYQSDIDWSKLKGIDFIICKKSEGLTLEDSKYKHNITNIPCLKGVYHFFRPQYSGVDQAKFFLSNLDIEDLDIIPVIDVEVTKWWTNSNKEVGIDRLCEMVEYIEKKIGRKPIIYTAPNFWNRFIGHNEKLSGVYLWIADWRGDSIPEVPNGFNKWHIWQQSSTKRIDGINGNVDWNISKSLDSLLL